MYHLTRGCDESSRLVSEPATSSSVPNLTTTEEELPPVEVRPTTYGSIDTFATSTNSENEPLITPDDQGSTNKDPKA